MAAAVDTALAPFTLPAFRDDLALLQESARQESRAYAERAVLLARLARQVPRVAGDESGASAWTSFLREVAVARRCSDRAATADVAAAQRLVAGLPQTLERLRSGDLPVPQARALVDESWGCSDGTLPHVDALASRACLLSPSRVRDAVRKVLLRVEADAVAVRSARAAASRHLRRTPLADDQAELSLVGPAALVAQAAQSVEAEARARRAAGDPRALDALRFDLAHHRLVEGHAPVLARRPPGAIDAPRGALSGTFAADGTGAEDTARAEDTACAGGPSGADDPANARHCCCRRPLAPLPDPTGREWLSDRRWSRPVRLDVTVPVTTALGLSNEPGWLAGHGWISAPTCRQLQVAAELRQLCVDVDSGVLVDLADRPVRPALDPVAVQRALRDMATHPFAITDTAWRTEPEHDPGGALREFVQLRDVLCDGPTGARVPAARAELDHDTPYPQGPTAAWNLVARSTRTHQLKHRGWVPVRALTSTLWFSPAGQVVEVPHVSEPLDPLEVGAALPDPVALHALETELLRPPSRDDDPPDW